MVDSLKINLNNETVHLLPAKAAFFPAQGALVLADAHLGKINHFRKAGIPVPVKANDRNTEALVNMLLEQNPQRFIFLGDLFHSHYNPEWEVLGQVIRNFPGVSFELVPGNHDIMSDYQYRKCGIQLHPPTLRLGNFLLTHEPTDHSGKEYQLAGHIHPAAVLRGKGRQSMTLPCFWLGKSQGVLPAFGVFTGLKKVKPEKEDRVYLVIEDKVIDAPSSLASGKNDAD